MIALCDKCNRITDIHYKTKHYPKGIQETYFDCDQCQHRFTCFVTDDKVRSTMKKMKRMRAEKKELHRLPSFQARVNKRMKELKAEVMNK